MRLDTEEFDVEDEGGVGRYVASALLAVGILGGDGDLHLVTGTHTGECHLESHDEVAHDEAGRKRLAGGGVKHLAVDEASCVVTIDDVGGASKSAVDGSRNDGTALDPAIDRAALQHVGSLLGGA